METTEWTQYLVEVLYGDLWIELPGFAGESLDAVKAGVATLGKLRQEARIIREHSIITRELVTGECR